MELKYIIEICVAIDIAILGIAYPIIINEINNIGEKYSSNYLSELFKIEFPQKETDIKFKKLFNIKISVFKLTLILTILSFLPLIINAKPLFGMDNLIINNSAQLITLFSTIILTFLFFIWLDKVILYNGKTSKILKYIIGLYDNPGGDLFKKDYALKTINEFSLYAIKKQDAHIQEELLKFYYKVFSDLREKNELGKPIEYPFDLYNLIYSINLELSGVKNLKLRALEHRAVSSSWLIGDDFREIPISETTYQWIWRNLRLISENPNYIKTYWAKVHQYFMMRLKEVYPEYIENSTNLKNKAEIDARIAERNEFIEFHYALGGLLLYTKEYNSLNYIFNYSQSSPPNYVLLPRTMTEIFTWFEEVRNPYKRFADSFDYKYSFPELDNLGVSSQINYWICCYLCVLFIRQYSLDTYYTYDDFTGQPNLPENVIELRNWLNSVAYFKKCLGDVLSNDELIGALGFKPVVNDEIFNKFLNDLKIKIEDKIGHIEISKKLSKEKIKLFKDSSKNIIQEAKSKYDSIIQSYDAAYIYDELKLAVRGIQTIMPKAAFVENEIDNMNFHSVIANGVASNEIMRFIPSAFAVARTKSYVVNQNIIGDVLKKIIGDMQKIEIIGFNVYPTIEDEIKKAGFNLKSLKSTQYQFDNKIFVLPKTQLPVLYYKTPTKEIEKEEELKPIIDSLNVYASIIDFNEEGYENIKKRWSNKSNENIEDLNVQVTIWLLWVIMWQKDRKLIQINIQSPYREQGISNSLEDILPL